MKELLLDDELSPVSSALQLIRATVGRRQILQTIGLVTAGLIVNPKVAVGQPSEAGQWRDTVTKFVETVCDGDYRRAKSINYHINQSEIAYAPAATTFHEQYWAPLVFVTRVLPQQVVCSNGFQVYRFPYYDTYQPCRRLNDLNAFEMRRISNQKEIQHFGCVVAPSSSRMQIQYSDHADYNRTVAQYPLNPNHIRPEYRRVFTGRGRSRNGYQVVHKYEVGPNGKPKRDVLLSDQDW